MIYSFTNNVVCRATIGRKFGADKGDKNLWKLTTEFNDLVGAVNVADFIPWLSIVNKFNGLNARVEKNYKGLDCFLESVIEEHIDPKKKTKDSGENIEDFVDVLLGMENDNTNRVSLARDNIKALILDMFAAGSDTSSATLIWAMTELIRNPEIMKEVQNEIREIAKGKLCITEDDLGKMHYLKMVIKETLRLHSPAPLLLPHESIQDTKLLGYDIPAKTRVFVNQWAIANDSMLWEDPEEFRPKRLDSYGTCLVSSRENGSLHGGRSTSQMIS
ncbi:Cytochrome p450 [Thalictrum thalictroides]|uniref:Cytochrome p450 n=1 Tax=Thalictrum thalictroides TaxID=46969 RepID=A0A7J6WH61_THATH|nr:Cytochrome p450 [Thalictrum thalictroides]